MHAQKTPVERSPFYPRDTEENHSLFLGRCVRLISKLFSPFNARELQRKYNSTYNENIDWHEFSGILSYLHMLKFVKVDMIDTDGMTRYRSAGAEVAEQFNF